jgi:hypothetical protein
MLGGQAAQQALVDAGLDKGLMMRSVTREMLVALKEMGVDMVELQRWMAAELGRAGGRWGAEPGCSRRRRAGLGWAGLSGPGGGNCCCPSPA